MRQAVTQPGELAARLDAYAFDAPGDPVAFAARLRGETGWTKRYARRAIAEYRRFVLLAVTGDAPSTPSPTIDHVWHLHLLDTRRYWDEFCAHTLRRPLHHLPSRGGAEEAARHAAQYHATLDRYAATFGVAPPADIWPDGRRATPAMSSVRRVLARFGAAAGLAAIAGCATLIDSSQPGAMQGPQFIGIYLLLWLVALPLLALVLGLGGAEDEVPMRAAHLDFEATAYLAGGAARARRTAELRLLRDGYLGIDAKRRKLFSDGEAPRDATPLQAAVHDTARLGGRAGRPAVQGALHRLRDGLVAQGLLPNPTERGRQMLLALVIVGPVFGLGLLRLAYGIGNHRPVGLLVFELAAAAIACPLLIRWRLSATAAGRRVLQEARAGIERGRRGAADPELLTAMALFGTAALSSFDFAGYTAYLRSSDGGGDGGGGGCGGGGGGCGG